MSRLAGKRILLIEDEALIAVMLEQMLNELGAQVMASATTVDAALALSSQVACDAAVLDVNLRGEPVFPAAELLGRRGIPVVFTTGYGQGALVPGQAAHVVEKPYTRDKLERALAAALGVTAQA